ncbi:MAG: class I SAM-dependent methyltransferase [Bacteroidota bacterium]
MRVKEHYDNHLGDFYSWMAGDFNAKQKEQTQFFETHAVKPTSTQIAIDLGAGHGIQAVALAKAGFKVKAIDFNQQLLRELTRNGKGLSIDVIEGDIRQVSNYAEVSPELIICWGDTLTHLETEEEVRQLLQDCAAVLIPDGKLILSFRDYSNALTGDNRFIPVKSDETKILTCFLDYSADYVRVTDLLHEKTEKGWEQRVSSYNKIRISSRQIVEILQQCGLTITFNEIMNRLLTIIAKK